MAKIIIAEHFKKDIKKIKSISINEVIKEIKKHHSGHANFIDLYSPIKGIKILKGYLDNKKSRLAVLLIVSSTIYAPCFVCKKESKDGINLSKSSSTDLLSYKTKNILNDIECNKLNEIEL